MGPIRHLFAGFAGALVCGAAGALVWTQVEPSWEASASLVVTSGAAGKVDIDPAAARALLTTEPVLRRAALNPEAAAAVERHARPSRLDRLLALTAAPSGADTMSRAVGFLAGRADVRPGAWPDTIEIVARMPVARDAAATATALAEAFAADVNETWAAARRRDGVQRAGRLERAARRLEDARDRLAALRAADPAPVGAIAPLASQNGATPLPLERARRQAAEAQARLAEAVRIYGPRHPELIARETEARQARDALDRVAPPQIATTRADPAPIATGGPDSRATDLVAAEDEAARAQIAHDLEAARADADRREARVIRRAAASVRPDGPSLGVTAFYAALGGFLLAGAAPALAGRPRRRRRDRATAVSPRVQIDVGDALALLALHESDGARMVTVVARTADLAETGAKALSRAALDEGWRPLLLVAGRASPAPDLPLRFARLGSGTLAIRAEATPAGPLDIATTAPRSPAGARTPDAQAVYDLVVIATEPASGRNAVAESDIVIAVRRGWSGRTTLEFSVVGRAPRT